MDLTEVVSMAKLSKLSVLLHAEKVIDLTCALRRLFLAVICLDFFTQARLPKIGAAMVLQKGNDII